MQTGEQLYKRHAGLSAFSLRRRGRRFGGALDAPLLLLTHRCSLSPRNKSVRKPRRSHGEAGAGTAWLGTRRETRSLLGTDSGMGGSGGNTSLTYSVEEVVRWQRSLGSPLKSFPFV